MNILDELRLDHDFIRSGLARFENGAPDPDAAEEVLAGIEEHIRLEEELLLRDLEPGLGPEGGLLDELRADHGRISLLIEAVRNGSRDPGRLDSLLRRLATTVRKHFDTEESAFFTFAERLLDADWRAGRGAAFRQARGPRNSGVGPDVRVSDLACEHPATIRVFQRHSIDFCCGGKRGLREACEQRGVDYETVAHEVRHALTGVAGESGEGWSRRPAVELVGHILARYHAGLRDELLRLEAMASRAAERHGDSHPRLREVSGLVHELRTRMTGHLEIEERSIFPAILSGSATTVAAELHTAEAEHDAVGELFRKIRSATDDFTPPATACNTWRGLYHGLAELERDTHVHVHLENNILFRHLSAEAAG
ncbi:MAG: iron-sulfur cluster repair di-iron protein [Thermoanaerobaculia bacterium]